MLDILHNALKLYRAHLVMQQDLLYRHDVESETVSAIQKEIDQIDRYLAGEWG